MQFLVFSDSHGRVEPMLRVLRKNPAIRHLLFLGDGLSDLPLIRGLFPGLTIRAVRGNMDMLSAAEIPTEEVLTLYGCRILLTHGHLLGVKGGTAAAEARARALGARVLLYGHTHLPEEHYLPEDSLLVCNPGSIGRPYAGAPSFAILDVLPDGSAVVSHGREMPFKE